MIISINYDDITWPIKLFIYLRQNHDTNPQSVKNQSKMTDKNEINPKLIANKVYFCIDIPSYQTRVSSIITAKNIRIRDFRTVQTNRE